MNTIHDGSYFFFLIILNETKTFSGVLKSTMGPGHCLFYLMGSLALGPYYPDCLSYTVQFPQLSSPYPYLLLLLIHQVEGSDESLKPRPAFPSLPPTLPWAITAQLHL